MPAMVRAEWPLASLHPVTGNEAGVGSSQACTPYGLAHRASSQLVAIGSLQDFTEDVNCAFEFLLKLTPLLDKADHRCKYVPTLPARCGCHQLILGDSVWSGLEQLPKRLSTLGLSAVSVLCPMSSSSQL